MPRVTLPKSKDEWAKLVARLTDGPNDRETVLIGGSLVDTTLEHMLLSWLLPDQAVEQFFNPLGSGFLSTFGAKKNLAFALALITDDERRDLERVASVRNVFAHHLLDAAFEHPKVVGWLK